MFTKTPVSMLLIIWMVGIVLFFNVFLGPFTEQLQTVKNINTQVNSLSIQNTDKSIAIDESIGDDLVDYSPLAVFDKFINGYSR